MCHAPIDEHPSTMMALMALLVQGISRATEAWSEVSSLEVGLRLRTLILQCHVAVLNGEGHERDAPPAHRMVELLAFLRELTLWLRVSRRRGYCHGTKARSLLHQQLQRLAIVRMLLEQEVAGQVSNHSELPKGQLSTAPLGV